MYDNDFENRIKKALRAYDDSDLVSLSETIRSRLDYADLTLVTIFDIVFGEEKKYDEEKLVKTLGLVFRKLRFCFKNPSDSEKVIAELKDILEGDDEIVVALSHDN